MTASAAVSEAMRDEDRPESHALRSPARHRVRDASVVVVIAVTQLAWMALLAYGVWLIA